MMFSQDLFIDHRGADDFPQVIRADGPRAVRVQAVKRREHGLLHRSRARWHGGRVASTSC